MPHPNNNRVFFATHGVSVNGTTVQGAQSVSLNTNFNLEQVFQLGRLAIYDNLQLDTEVELTLSKALDGHNTIFNLACADNNISLVESEPKKATLILGIGDDDADALTNTQCIQMTGCYISSLNYTFPVDGQFTEEITFLGNHKAITGTVTAPTANPSTRVLGRQNYSSNSVVPSEVDGKRLSQITISADLGREALYELGKFYPYHRFVNFPVEITVAFDVISGTHDGVEVDIQNLPDCQSPTTNAKQNIDLIFCNDAGNITYEFNFDDDEGNPTATLQSVSYSGGDTGGGNVTTTYTYVVYNTLTIIYT